MKAKSSVKYMGISHTARKMGCAEGTVRDLDRRGIIHPIRDSANRRLFGDDDVEAGQEYLQRTRAAVAV
jgi:DNA-binding transcriptional MerR regulator